MIVIQKDTTASLCTEQINLIKNTLQFAYEGYQDIKKINSVLSLANDSHLKLNQELFSG